MLKVLYPIGSFYPSQSGGPNNTMYWIAEALKAKGHYPVIVTTTSGIKTDHQIVKNQWLTTDYGKVIYNTERFIYFPIRSIFHSIRSIKECDIIHLNSIFYPLSWIIAFTNYLFYKRPVVWSSRGELDPDALVYSTKKKSVVLKTIVNPIAKSILFHGTCPSEIEYIKKNIRNTTKTVEIANYLKMPAPVTTAVQDKFLYIGRIHPKKAIENLILACNKSVLLRKSNFILQIAGDHQNPYGESLEKLVQDLGLEKRIVFLGHIEKSEKQSVLASSYFSFLPSHTENFGNVVIESLAQSTPVIASTGTPWSSLESWGAGYHVSNAPASLGLMIDKVLELPDKEYASMRKAALSMASSDYDIKKNIYRWEDAYRTLVADSQK